jgi:hypothetical protein
VMVVLNNPFPSVRKRSVALIWNRGWQSGIASYYCPRSWETMSLGLDPGTILALSVLTHSLAVNL